MNFFLNKFYVERS